MITIRVVENGCNHYFKANNMSSARLLVEWLKFATGGEVSIM